jgi:ABC-type glycerol-3-phosphate transport system substrate-binding protein
LWGGTSGVPTTTMEAYAPPAAWNGAKVTGALGGGLWMVMKHTAQPKAAAALAQWLSTNVKVQGNPKIEGGLPDYVPDQAKYLASLNGVYANPAATEAAWKTAAGEVWGGWSPVAWSTDAIWGNSVTPNLVAGQKWSAQIAPYAASLKAAAQNAGWQVKS